MRITPNWEPSLLAVAGILAASAAQALELDEPVFGGAYAPAPNYAYSRGYGEAARIGGGVSVAGIGVAAGVEVGAVGYDQGYYYGGYQYPAGGYGGGPYRRAAYSAADVYVNGGYPPPYPAYRLPYARGYYAPAPGYYYAPSPVYGRYYNAGYRPHRGVRQQCQCVLY